MPGCDRSVGEDDIAVLRCDAQDRAIQRLWLKINRRRSLRAQPRAGFFLKVLG